MSALDDWMAFTIWFQNFRHHSHRKTRGRPSLDVVDRGLIDAIERAMKEYPNGDKPFQTRLKKMAMLRYGDGPRTEAVRDQFVDRIMRKRREKSG